MEAAEVMFAAAGDADFGARVEKAEETEDFQTTLRREVVAMFKGSPGHWMQGILGNGVRLHFAEGHRQIDQVFVFLAHADDAAGADF